MDGISKLGGDGVIALKQLDLAHRRLRFSLVSSLSVAVLAVVALWPSVAGMTLLLWLAALCAVLAVRYLDSRRFLDIGYGVSFELARWKTRFAAGAALEGACWGATVICFLVTPHDDVAAMMMFVIAGTSAFASVAMASERRAALAFQFPALIPTAVWLFSFGELQHQFMGAFVLAYLGLLLLLSRQMGGMIRTSLSTTEQNKELSAAVREGDQRMSRYFENAPGCLFTMRRDKDGRISMPFVSNGITVLYGLRPEGVEKNIAPMLALCPPGDVDRIVQGMERSAKNMTPCHVEYRVKHPAKGELWVEARSLPRKDGDGSIVWHGIMLDITGQKRAQSRLELLDTAVNHSSDAIFLIGDNGRFHYVNDAACRSLDYCHAELLGMGIPDIDPQITREQLADMEARFDAGEKFAPMETLHRARDGREFPVEVSISRVEYNGERFSLAVVRDISERKRMEGALKQRETEFRALAENLPDPVFRYDRECRRVYVNPAAERITAMRAEQLLGNMPSNCVTLTPDSAVRAMAAIREVFATGESSETYVEYDMGDGKTREYKGLAVPEFGADGQVATVLAIVHEVTDLLAAERRAASFFANMPGFAYTFSLSPEGRMSFPFASRGIEDIFGLHPEDVSEDASSLLALVHFDDRQRVKAEIAGAVESLRPFQVEARVQRPGQPERWIECRSMPERQAGGDVLWHGVMLDITGRKRVEAELRRTTDFQKLLLDGLREVGMWQLVVEDGKIIYHNDSHIGGLLGYAAGDFGAMPGYIEVIHPDDRARIAEMYRRRLAGEAVPNSYEVGLLAKDGSRREHQLYVSLIPDSDPPRTMTLAVDITERKRMLESLAAREREFRSLAENLPDNIARFDTQGRYLYINPTHERMLGISASDIIGMEIPASHEHVKAAIAQVVATGRSVELVRQPALVNGEMQIHEVSLSPEFDADGRIVSVLGVGRNMTNIYRMQEAIAAREREFRSLAEHLPDNIVRWDSLGRYAYVNPTAERSIGARSEEVCGKRPSEAFPDGRFSTLEAAIDSILATGQAMPCLHQTVPMENGEVRFHEISLAPERDAAGQVIGVLCVGRDMTEIHRMQEAIAAREQEFRSLAESAPDNIIRYDREGRICFINAVLLANFGVSSAETLLGRLPSEVWPDGRYDVIEQAALRVVESGAAESLELCEPIGPGDDHFHHVMIVPERDAGGNIIGTIVFGRDVTEMKKAKVLLEARYEQVVALSRHLEESSRNLEEQTVELEASQTQLKETLEFTEGIINAIPDILFEVDRDGRYLNVWAQKPELLAMPKDMLLGRTFHEVLPSGEAETAMEALREAEAQGHSFGKHLRLDLPQGQGWFELSVSRKPASYPADVRFLVLSRDVTVRKEMERTVQESEARYRQNYHLLQSVFESASDVSVFALDRDYRYLSFNAQHRENTKRLRGVDITVGMSMLDAIRREEFREFCRRGYDRVLAGDSVSVESREEIMQADGSVTYEYYENHGSPIRNDAGEIVGLTVFTHNITERKRYEEQLAQLNYALDQADPAFLSEEGRIVYVNKSACRVLGYSEEELIGLAFDSIDPHVTPEMNAGIRRALEAQGSYTFESRHKTKSGHTIPVEVSLTMSRFGDKSRVLSLARDITARKAIEKTLHDNEKMLQEAQRIAHVGSWDVDIVNDKLVWSDEIFRIWEIDKTKFRADFAAFMETVHPEDRELVGRVYNESLVNHSLYEVEHRLLFPDGRVKHILERGEPHYDAQGKPVRFIGTSLDITERKLAEEKRNELQRQLQMIAEHMPGAMTHYRLHPDLNGQMLYASKGLHDLFGLTMQDLNDGLAPMIERIHPDDMPRAVAEQEHAARTLTTTISEFRVNHPEKGEIWVQQITTPVPESESSMLWYSLMFDITERKRMEEEIAGARTFLNTVIDGISDPIFVKDTQHRWTLMNDACCKLLGQPREVLLGKSDYDFLPKEQADVFWEKDEIVFRSGEINLNEEAINGPDGGLRYIQTVKTPFKSADGQAMLVAVLRDITERKRVEEALAAREQEFRTLVEHTPDTIARYDRECRRTFVNEAFCALVEGGAAALLGKTPTECPGGANADIYEARINDVFATGKDVEFELHWHDLDDNEICSHIRITAERDSSGEVVSVLAVGHDITELNLSRQKIHQMAFFDALTGLPNRVLLNDRLHQMLIESSRHGQYAGVMMLDLDRFKAINDTLGHPAGDALLREAGARLTSCLRDYDTVARLGGDEFAVLLPEVRSGDDMGTIASKILGVFKEPFMLENKEVFISTSIGIAVYPNDSTDADELLKQADSAMYSAKRSGRNAFRCYSKDLTESANEKLTLESDLRRGFGRGELELYFQPKIRLADGVLLGSEALLRWRHPACGMIGPDRFIPIAEDSGLIVEIGAWVLRDACRTASGWNGPGKPLHKVAINLSARQFQSGDLVQTVRDALSEADCRTEWIELEITESLLLDEDGSALEMLESFRAMGITIAIDDFGTGYSSLSYLSRFPIDTLKIDRSFTSKVIGSQHHAELVKAMISIAQSLNQQVVAEGVETEEEAAFLRAHGCQIAQGYLFGKPVPKAEFGLLPFALDKRDRRLKQDSAES